MFTVALLITAPNWKQPKCSKITKWKTVQYSDDKCYSVIKRNMTAKIGNKTVHTILFCI